MGCVNGNPEKKHLTKDAKANTNPASQNAAISPPDLHMSNALTNDLNLQNPAASNFHNPADHQLNGMLPNTNAHNLVQDAAHHSINHVSNAAVDNLHAGKS